MMVGVFLFVFLLERLVLEMSAICFETRPVSLSLVSMDTDEVS